MKRQIRHGVFETNSSSTHSLQIMSADDFNRWNGSDLYLYDGSDWGWEDKSKAPKTNSIYTKEEAIEFIKVSKYPPEEDFDYEDDYEVAILLRDNDFHNSDYYFEGNYETFEKEYTTPSGDNIVVFGYYGYDY